MLGSVATLLFAALAVASIFIQPQQGQPPNSVQFAVFGSAMMAALACFGIWTSVGLFRLRSWARTSILIFAGFAAAWCILALVVGRMMPMPPDVPSGAERTVRQAMMLGFGIPLAITVWWLIQFNTPSAKAAFASPIPDAASSRPLSISIIAWSCILGGASCVIMGLTRQPAFLVGAVFNGWSAGVFYAFFAALSLYIGKGLLDLRERARIVAISWFGFSLVHLGFITLVPSVRQRMLDLQRTLERNQPQPIPFDQGMMTNVILAFTAITVVVAIWFLIRNRTAFARAENP
jgi:hypothetical protein